MPHKLKFPTVYSASRRHARFGLPNVVIHRFDSDALPRLASVLPADDLHTIKLKRIEHSARCKQTLDHCGYLSTII